MKKTTFFTLLLLCVLCIASQVVKAQDGPYVIYEPNGKVNVTSFDKKNNLKNISYNNKSEIRQLTVISEEGNFKFNVPLFDFAKQPALYKNSDKLLVISDPHGEMKPFVSVLKGCGVIDSKLNWSFGSGELIILGDVLDRGEDVLPIFWLIYKLEQEAAKSGGRVHMMLGNHEEMVLRADLRYVDDKYLETAKKMNVTHDKLWAENTELGRWLRSKNQMEIIGDNLFVHAGIGADFLKLNLTIDQTNEIIRENLGLTRKQIEDKSKLAKNVYGSYGPFWYRGLVLKSEKYKPIKDKTLESILKRYNVKRIIVGHTIFKNVSTFHKKQVIAVNVENKKNMERKLSRGILIEGNSIYIINDAGKKKPL